MYSSAMLLAFASNGKYSAGAAISCDSLCHRSLSDRMKNRRPLVESTRLEFRQETAPGRFSLRIAKARPEDSGWYTCRASSAAGTAYTEAEVTVRSEFRFLFRYPCKRKYRKTAFLQASVVARDHRTRSHGSVQLPTRNSRGDFVIASLRGASRVRSPQPWLAVPNRWYSG